MNGMFSKMTMEEAMAIQDQHLRQWETVLKPEIFAQVKEAVLAKNTPDVTNPFDVCRGTSIDMIVMNVAARLFQEQS